ncbi:RWD domain-containing protein 3-like [Antedon mediterranea]|uniref:RWD domain-containing protein 3-like n=1 Tax=Antedon mediterranea TaxID=105859 RepID=UPI003AF46A15
MAESAMIDNYDISYELEALKAIFSGDGEFTELSDLNSPNKLFRIQIKLEEINHGRPVNLQITFTLPRDYPNNLPDISLSSTELNRKFLDSLKHDLLVHSEDLRSQPMIMDQVMWVQENAGKYIQTEAASVEVAGSSSQAGCTVLCQLDHMRARTKYCKKLCKWALDLSVRGGIFFVKNLIFILLNGSQINVKEFLVRLKTQNVDVDSHGKSCKERMMKVLVDLLYLQALYLN